MSLDVLMQSPTFTYFVILGLSVFIYRSVFAKSQRLPILKSAIVYFVLAIGCILFNFFQLQVGLPIIESLLVAVAMMLIVYIRRKTTAKPKRSTRG